jgi:uncharacterized repeat protein (TIGR02543 family)
MVFEKRCHWKHWGVLIGTVLAFVLVGGFLSGADHAAAATSSLTTAWDDPTPNDHDGFTLQRKTGTTGTYSLLATLGASVRSYLDTTATAGTTYCYEVAAYNASGSSAVSNEACATAPTPLLSSLSVTMTGSGTVASSPAGITCGSTCSASFATGTSIALSATPAAGFTFTGWGGPCTGLGACTLILTQNQTLTATFTAVPPATYPLTLTTTGAGSGTVTSSPAGITCGSTCSASFTSGASVSLTATPAAGSTFTGWSGACTGTGSCAVTVTQASSVSATFTIIPPTTYPLSVAVTGSGTVASSPAGITCGTTCSASFTSGASVSLTATPTAGSTFTGWSGACSGTGTCAVAMSQAKSVTATFTTGIRFVQAAAAVPQTPTQTVTVAVSKAQTAGGLNVVVVGWNDTTATVQTVTDTRGNVYRLAVGPTSGTGIRQAIYYAPAIAAGANSVSVKFSQAAVYPDIRVLEYAGVSTLDQISAATGNGTSATNCSVTTTTANEVLVAANTVATLTKGPAASFTTRILTAPNGDIAEDRIVSAAGSYSASTPLSSVGPWVMQMVTFK